MRPTLEYVKKKFGEFNNLYFGGALPDLPIKLSRAGKSLGMFTYPRKGVPGSTGDIRRCSLRVSTCFDLPEDEVENTIIHEMIHYWIWLKNLRDSSSHGPVFRQKMEQINSASGRKITISHRSEEDQLDSDNRVRPHFICVSEWRDGRRGVTVCARTRIFEIHRVISTHPDVIVFRWYWSVDPWFNRFPAVRVPKVVFSLPDNIDDYLAMALPCACDGKTFRLIR